MTSILEALLLFTSLHRCQRYNPTSPTAGSKVISAGAMSASQESRGGIYVESFFLEDEEAEIKSIH